MTIQEVRSAVFKRDEYACRHCGHEGKATSPELDITAMSLEKKKKSKKKSTQKIWLTKDCITVCWNCYKKVQANVMRPRCLEGEVGADGLVLFTMVSK